MPLFSVIIPSYNREKLIRATLDSVLAQDFDDFEIIVADDGSKDNSANVVREYVEKFPGKVKLFVQPNKGEGAARNLAIAQARGEYLAYLDSDDLFFPWALSTYARAIHEHGPLAAIAGTGVPFVDPAELQRHSNGEYRAEQAADMFAYIARRAETLPPSSSVMRKDLVDSVGRFLERNINCVDLDLWLRVGDAKGFVRIFSPLVTGRREHASNVTANKDMTINGATNLVEREKSGAYAGGPSRRNDRLKFMLLHVRWMTAQCIQGGRQAAGWKLYRSCFAWHLALGRFRFLIGFPLMSLAYLFRLKR